MEKYDMIVVGAGWHGLIAAKVYLELHPSEDILVLEAESSCGGTWSANRLYPGLKSNNLLDTYESPDYPMSTETYGVKPGEHIPAAVMHRYLTNFAKKFGVFTRTRFNTRVDSVDESSTGGWIVTTSSDSTQGQQKIETSKIIIATGLTSQPNFPKYTGSESFEAPYFHAKDFCRNGQTVNTAESAVIVGAGKSAYDVAYAYADHGVQVDLIVRPGGAGPVYISYPWVMGGGKRLEQLLSVRWMTWFSPCIFGGIDGWKWVRSFLHGTAVGRFLVKQFWGGLEGENFQLNKYKTDPNLQKLQPWHNAFWIGSGLSIHNYDHDFFDMVKDRKIRVHVADVDHLTKKTVHLSNGEELKADVLVCATGWSKDTSLKFNFEAVDIGLVKNPTEKARLATEADDKILKTFPKLRDQPQLDYKPKGDPYRLYRYIVPPAKMKARNIAYAGMISTVSTATVGSVQALWISAYLDGRLDIEASTPEEVTEEVMLHTQWNKWRHPTGYGASIPDMVFDALPYMDMLVRDLGLKVNRKAGFFQDITVPYSPRDYTGLVDEWINAHQKA